MASTTVPYRLPDGRIAIDVNANKTYAAADMGIVQNIIKDGLTHTLPATSAKLQLTFRNGGVPVTNGPVGSGSDQSATITLTPASGDSFTGAGIASPTINKTLQNVTGNIGDEVTIRGTGVNDATAWSVVNNRGALWTRGA